MTVANSVSIMKTTEHDTLNWWIVCEIYLNKAINKKFTYLIKFTTALA